MRTITGENQKPFRKAMDVMLCIDASIYAVTNITEVNNTWYQGSTYRRSYIANEPYKKQILMDFAGGGFYNDGEAVPISENGAGENTTYGIPAAAVGSQIVYRVTASDEVPAGTKYYGIVYDSKGQMYRVTWTRNSASTSWNVNLTSSFSSKFPQDERIYIGFITIGNAWMFDNTNIINASLNLRSVETKIDNPSLQSSEIEFTVRADSDYSKDLTALKKNSPIYYSAGYSGDMSEVRTFYANEITYDKTTKTIAVHGYDATEFLDTDFKGAFRRNIKTGNMRYDIAVNFMDMIDDVLEYKYGIKTLGDSDFTQSTLGSNFTYLIENKNIRDIIANMCNLWSVNGLSINYVDAGKPKMWVASTDPEASVYEDVEDRDFLYNLGNEPKTISSMFISDFSVAVDPTIKEISLPVTQIMSDTQASIENRKTYTIGKHYRVKTGDMYSAFSVASSSSPSVFTDISSDAVSLSEVFAEIIYTPQQYLFGDKIIFEESNTYTATGTGNEEYDLETQNGELKFYDGNNTVNVFQTVVQDLISRSPMVYTFRYRGDPRMQPRDVLTVNGIQMTVESLTLEHSEGGALTSQITARGGRL